MVANTDHVLEVIRELQRPGLCGPRGALVMLEAARILEGTLTEPDLTIGRMIRSWIWQEVAREARLNPSCPGTVRAEAGRRARQLSGLFYWSTGLMITSGDPELRGVAQELRDRIEALDAQIAGT